MARLNISTLVKWELERYRGECNFTQDELSFFNFRAKDNSLVEIAISMNISKGKVDNLSKSVQRKIEKAKESNQ